MQLNLEAFTSRETIVASLVITVLAVATKFVGCGLASIRLGLRRAAQIGIGMAPRGEVGIVVAQLGIGFGVMSDQVFPVVLLQDKRRRVLWGNGCSLLLDLG